MTARRRRAELATLGINRPKSLATLVADRLRQAIFTTEIKLGQVLSEEGIAATMKVSRTPVREALTMLQLQGLIEIKPQRGSVVFKPDADDIASLVQFRLTLELAAAPLAMAHAPDATHRDLMDAVRAMEAAREADRMLDFAEADARFHHALIAHCGNRYFEEAYALVAGRLSALRAHLAGPLVVHRSRVHAEHTGIADAFAARDQEQLRALLAAHILAMTENYVRALTTS